MISHRHLATISLVCLIVVATATTIKLSELQKANNPSKIPAKTGVVRDTSRKAPDASFFTNADKTADKSSTAVTVARNTYGVTSRAFIVGNVATDQVYLRQDSARALPVASMSKLVTAFAATDQYSDSKIIGIVPGLASTTPPDGSNLLDGEKFTLKEILYPLLLSSSNIAAEAIAASSDRAKFQELMSSYAWEVGMPKSYFADPSGVSPYNIASAEDLFALAKYLYKYRPDVLAITKNATYSIATTTEHGSHEIKSTHPFVNDSRFIGGKTGRTMEAGETMMTILNINSQPVAFIILGSKYGMREVDTRKLISLVENSIK